MLRNVQCWFMIDSGRAQGRGAGAASPLRSLFSNVWLIKGSGGFLIYKAGSWERMGLYFPGSSLICAEAHFSCNPHHSIIFDPSSSLFVSLLSPYRLIFIMSGLLPPAKFPSSFFSRNGSYKECEGWPKLRSLQLDTVMPRRQRQSLPKLLQLPVELLDRIIDLLEDDKKALASLALVDSVCRYLARACQFKEIHFDYSPQSHELLRHMAT